MDREAEPPALRSDLEIGPPDFIGVGSQKSGTSWWYSLICRHPMVFHDEAVHKERHFFERYWNRPFGEADVSRYHRWFRRPPGTITGEWTPDYMARPWVTPLLVSAAPEARLLIMLRDPMTRLASGLDHYTRRDTAITPWLISDVINRGRYGEQIQQLMNHARPEKLLILQYELCVRDTTRQVQRTLEFLDLPNASIDINTSDQRRSTRAAQVEVPSQVLECARNLYSADRSILVKLCDDFDFELWVAG